MNSAEWQHVQALVAAAILAGIGGEMFVRAVVGTAARWRLSEMLLAIQTTFATTYA